jgi:hypothetical protein
VNREQKAALLLMHQAAAAALAADLKASAKEEHEKHGTGVSWRTKPALITGNIAKDRAVVVDDQAFYAYLAKIHPEEFVERLAPRNPSWVEIVRRSMLPFAERDPETKKPTGRVLDREGTVVPGLAYERGGGYVSTSITPNAETAKVLLDAARYAVRTGEWAPLWAYTDEADPQIVLAMMEEHPDGPPVPGGEVSPTEPATG